MSNDRRLALLVAEQTVKYCEQGMNLQAVLQKIGEAFAEEELNEEGPLWRTLFTENEQETIALLTIEDIRDCAKDLAHEQLDNIGPDGLTELIAMIDPNLPVTVECLKAIRDGNADMDDYRSHEHVDHYVAAQFIERFDLVQNSEELSDRGRQYIEENS